MPLWVLTIRGQDVQPSNNYHQSTRAFNGFTRISHLSQNWMMKSFTGFIPVSCQRNRVSFFLSMNTPLISYESHLICLNPTNNNHHLQVCLERFVKSPLFPPPVFHFLSGKTLIHEGNSHIKSHVGIRHLESLRYNTYFA